MNHTTRNNRIGIFLIAACVTKDYLGKVRIRRGLVQAHSNPRSDEGVRGDRNVGRFSFTPWSLIVQATRSERPAWKLDAVETKAKSLYLGMKFAERVDRCYDKLGSKPGDTLQVSV